MQDYSFLIVHYSFNKAFVFNSSNSFYSFNFLD